MERRTEVIRTSGDLPPDTAFRFHIPGTRTIHFKKLQMPKVLDGEEEYPSCSTAHDGTQINPSNCCNTQYKVIQRGAEGTLISMSIIDTGRERFG